jgi:hypothetical protein
MTRALFVLTPAESKRLIGKAVAGMEEVQHAFRHSNILISHGSTNIYVLEELLGKQKISELMEPPSFVTGLIKRGTLCSTAAKKKTPIVLLKKGIVTPPAATMSEMLRDFNSHSVVIKGANAVDAEGNAGVFVANPEGGTIGWAIGTILARGIRLIVPVGLEKQVPSVKKAASLCGQDTFDYIQGMKVGMIPMSNAWVVTEIAAIKILTGVDIFHVASGGVNGSEGSVVLVAEGESKAIRKTIKLIESIKGEIPLHFRLDACETCPTASQKPSTVPGSARSTGNCQYRGKKAEELPAYMRGD